MTLDNISSNILFLTLKTISTNLHIILHTWYMLLKSTSLNFFLINGWLYRVMVLVVEVSIGEVRRRRGRGGIRERGGGTPVLPKR